MNILRVLLVSSLVAVDGTTASSPRGDVTTNTDDVTSGLAYQPVISHPALDTSEGYIPGAVYQGKLMRWFFLTNGYSHEFFPQCINT